MGKGTLKKMLQGAVVICIFFMLGMIAVNPSNGKASSAKIQAEQTNDTETTLTGGQTEDGAGFLFVFFGIILLIIFVVLITVLSTISSVAGSIGAGEVE